MIQIHSFSFNPFQENTFVLSNSSNECIIIDAGCYFDKEKKALLDYINQKKLKPISFLNTHAHLDHVFGLQYLKQQFPDVPFLLHERELPVLNSAVAVSTKYGVPCDTPPQPNTLINENTDLIFGDEKIKILFTPGHSPGSLSFYFEKEKFVISGDCLFQQSIGRTDLPGGDFSTLVQSIRTQLFSLPDETKVYSGHGGITTIGEEKNFNPFVGVNK
jgi:glyoxylase-like metal-dependent hydrolase (beta-lactamase superfamily II)